MGNKIYYSHFIQRAFAQRWGKNDKVSYIMRGTNDGGYFDPSNYAKYQPIALKNYYIEEIEKGMNILEDEGNKVIRKILLETSEITLTRKEADTIKFYFILTSLRTKMVRTKMKKTNSDDDEFYIKMIKSFKGTNQEFQELQMKLIFEKYNKYRKDGILIFTELEDELEANFNKVIKGKTKETSEDIFLNEFMESCSIELVARDYMNLLLESKLIFVKFNEGELFLTEATGFVERQSFNSLEVKYAFFPISPNMGILFIPDLLVWEAPKHVLPKSIIFTFDLNEKNQITYKKEAKIIELKKKNFKKFKALDNIESNQDHLFNFKDKKDFFTSNDQFIYPIHYEEEKISIMCNIMALAECNDSYVIYKSIHNYYNALYKWK